MAFAVGQLWDIIFPLLTRLGYIFCYGEKLIIHQLNFHNMQHVIPGVNRLHISFHHHMGESRQYNICAGKPYYGGPTKQITATENQKLHIRIYDI